MWDAWAAYEPSARGYFSRQKRSVSAKALRAEQEKSISFAAYTVLRNRYQHAVQAGTNLAAFENQMADLCLRQDDKSDAAKLGRTIGETAIRFGDADGSLQDKSYVDPAYTPKNPPLPIDLEGITTNDPNRWQPLKMKNPITQNGLLVPSDVQTFLGSQWGHVKGFALPTPGPGVQVAIDPGPPSRLGDPKTDAAYKRGAVDVIRASATLDASDPATINISPSAFGNNPLGSNTGTGYVTNPSTKRPYPANNVRLADFNRVIAEYWADGPHSETPPGHWNVIANRVSDSPIQSLRLRGRGPRLDRLEWDVKLYLSINGALHDAAIAAWGLKAKYEGPRPISMIRYMASQGQSTDPKLASFNVRGLPLVPGLIELVTAESSRPGAAHAAFAGQTGAVVVRSWQARSAVRTDGTRGVGWVLGTDWTTYQRPTFVTPAFPGYVSGHSTFSRAAAEVLAGFTGSPFFPGGLLEERVSFGGLAFEKGPTEPVTLQWATYFDAADQAGQSRIFGGIHVPEDDFIGRRIGSPVGKAAFEKATTYFGRL